jgi:prepilin-type processing-associated H-X9-DG protein
VYKAVTCYRVNILTGRADKSTKTGVFFQNNSQSAFSAAQLPIRQGIVLAMPVNQCIIITAMSFTRKENDMYCPKCGTQNPENAKVCLSCAQSLPVLSDAPQTGVKTSALAIWSFVLAIIGLFTFMLTALPALICGIIGLVKISKSKGQLKGTGLAITGIVIPTISAIFLPILMILLAILMPALGNVKPLAQRIMCVANLSSLGTTMTVYTEDHNDMYPPADNWCALLIADGNESPFEFICPGSSAVKGESSYAININVAGKKISGIPPDTVVLFETNPGVNPAGGPEILSTKNHQNNGCNILFADGHPKFVKTADFPTLRWTWE